MKTAKTVKTAMMRSHSLISHSGVAQAGDVNRAISRCAVAAGATLAAQEARVTRRMPDSLATSNAGYNVDDLLFTEFTSVMSPVRKKDFLEKMRFDLGLHERAAA